MHPFDLKLFRKSKTKLSQEEFAKKIGFSKGTIGKIEAGYASVTDNILGRIEEIFNEDLSEYKSYHYSRYKRPAGTETTSLVSEHMEQYMLNQQGLVQLVKEYGQKLEDCHKEKEALLKQISDLEKQLLSQSIKGKTGK